jgi:hypothetical protein
MNRTRIVMALAVLALAASTVCAASAMAEPSQLCKPGEMRKYGHPTYYWTLDDWFSGNESYRVFCCPLSEGACDGGWKPVSVTMYLYWEESNSCALTVRAELHRSATIDPHGAGAGDLIASSEPTTVGPFRPAGLWAVTIPLPTDAPTIDGPCYASIEFLDTCDEPPALVAAPGACDGNRSWVDRGDGWVDMRDLELPGNLSAYATFECQRPTEDKPVSWGTVKGMYGTDR